MLKVRQSPGSKEYFTISPEDIRKAVTTVVVSNSIWKNCGICRKDHSAILSAVFYELGIRAVCDAYEEEAKKHTKPIVGGNFAQIMGSYMNVMRPYDKFYKKYRESANQILIEELEKIEHEKKQKWAETHLKHSKGGNHGD